MLDISKDLTIIKNVNLIRLAKDLLLCTIMLWLWAKSAKASFTSSLLQRSLAKTKRMNDTPWPYCHWAAQGLAARLGRSSSETQSHFICVVKHIAGKRWAKNAKSNLSGFCISIIEEMVSADLSFIIPTTSNLKNVKEAISAIHKSIDDPEHLRLYEKETLFVI